MAKLTLTQRRAVAVGAIRAQARHTGVEPRTLSAVQAVAILDDILRTEPELVASQWYATASEAQLNMLMREWNSWRKGY